MEFRGPRKDEVGGSLRLDGLTKVSRVEWSRSVGCCGADMVFIYVLTGDIFLLSME